MPTEMLALVEALVHHAEDLRSAASAAEARGALVVLEPGEARMLADLLVATALVASPG